MCHLNTGPARGAPGTCQTQKRAITGDSDLPWTAGYPGVIATRQVASDQAVWVTAPDTARGGHSFDWALLLHHGAHGHWRVTDYHQIIGAHPNPLDYYYGDTR